MHSLAVRKFVSGSIRSGVSRRSASVKLLSTWTATHDASRVGTSSAEGDVWDHNYSLTEDGVVNSKLAFRNAKTSTIMNRLPAKVSGGQVELKDVNLQGTYTLVEAGEELDHDQFEELLEEQHDYLSTDKVLFFEDFGLGASSNCRIGARMISENPAHSLIFRSLMINTPPRPTDHRARYNGWNLDERWQITDYTWNGTEYDFNSKQTIPSRGERPVIAFVGGARDAVALQFVQQTGNAGGIAGSNIVAGANTSARGIVEAYGNAAAAMMNAEVPDSVTTASVVSSKGSETNIFVGSFSDSFVTKVHAKGSLYGAYFNTLTSNGVSAVFGGFIGPAKAVSAPAAGSFSSNSFPVVVSGEVSTVSLSPDNCVATPKNVIFVDAKASTISAEEAAARLADGDESKIEIAKALLGGAKVIVVKSEETAEKYIL